MRSGNTIERAVSIKCRDTTLGYAYSQWKQKKAKWESARMLNDVSIIAHQEWLHPRSQACIVNYSHRSNISKSLHYLVRASKWKRGLAIFNGLIQNSDRVWCPSTQQTWRSATKDAIEDIGFVKYAAHTKSMRVIVYPIEKWYPNREVGVGEADSLSTRIELIFLDAPITASDIHIIPFIIARDSPHTIPLTYDTLQYVSKRRNSITYTHRTNKRLLWQHPQWSSQVSARYACRNDTCKQYEKSLYLIPALSLPAPR